NKQVVRFPIHRYRDLGRLHLLEHRRWQRRVEGQIGVIEDSRERRSVVSELSARLLLIGRLLGSAYGTPDLGNKADPVDELVYIILSRRTRESAYQAAYDALRKRYEKWDDVPTATTT